MCMCTDSVITSHLENYCYTSLVVSPARIHNECNNGSDQRATTYETQFTLTPLGAKSETDENILRHHLIDVYARNTHKLNTISWLALIVEAGTKKLSVQICASAARQSSPRKRSNSSCTKWRADPNVSPMRYRADAAGFCANYPIGM